MIIFIKAALSGVDLSIGFPVQDGGCHFLSSGKYNVCADILVIFIHIIQFFKVVFISERIGPFWFVNNTVKFIICEEIIDFVAALLWLTCRPL